MPGGTSQLDGVESITVILAGLEITISLGLFLDRVFQLVTTSWSPVWVAISRLWLSRSLRIGSGSSL